VIRFEDVPGILRGLLDADIPNDWPNGEITQVEQDTRRITRTALFVSIPGTREDGRAYLSEAAALGARAVVGPAPASGSLPYLAVRDPRKASALLSARLQGDPSRELDLIGITGTNGKTTTSWLLHSVLEGCGIPAAVSGTLGTGRPGTLAAATHTTPDAPRFQEALRGLVGQGIRAVAAEVSSHALDQDRTYGSRFRAAVFTNLTRDHLDYHGTFEAYREAKRRLFHPAGRGDTAPCTSVVNLDDPSAGALTAGTSDPVFGYGTSPEARARLETLEADANGVRLRVSTPLGRREVRSPLVGGFNGWNLLAAYATALAIDLPAGRVEAALAKGVQVPGRMERVERGQPFLVVVDFAHTPDALERALAALRAITRGRLIVLFGCGGDRDAGKRPQMGSIAARGADRVIVTSDNPRSEPPEAILEAIVRGVRAEGREPDAVRLDREEAIREAIALAHPDDTLLIAGKGHEAYQEIGGVRRPFDDREAAARCLAERGWSA
jgi:UDP-N-acetylmuramoyl-L-alanyl-D-glutamate--2,6-diaminopimelate ligase